MANILLIDDDDLVQSTLHRILLQAGHEVTVTNNGAVGLQKFLERTPDLVITDIFMPEQEGLETILKIRKVSGTVPIIAMSGLENMANLNLFGAAEAFGATRVLQKPFGAQKLWDAIEFCLAGTLRPGVQPRRSA